MLELHGNDIRLIYSSQGDYQQEAGKFRIKSSVIKNMASFDEIDEARKLPWFSDAATLKDIKNSYKRLAHRYHPDRHSGKDGDVEIMKKLNRAYELLMNYCKNYKYSFKEEDVARTYPYDEYLRKHPFRWFDNI